MNILSFVDKVAKSCSSFAEIPLLGMTGSVGAWLIYPHAPQEFEQWFSAVLRTSVRTAGCCKSRARGVIGLLVDEVNPLVSVMKVDKARMAACRDFVMPCP